MSPLLSGRFRTALSGLVFTGAAIAVIADAAAQTQSGPQPERAQVAAFRPSAPAARTVAAQGLGADERGRHVAFDAAALKCAARTGSTIRLKGVPLDRDVVVDLELAPFRVATHETRFVKGVAGGRDAPLAFDPQSVLLLRGSIAGAASSSVYLALGSAHARGIISAGPGGRQWNLAARRDEAGKAMPNQFSIAPTNGGRSLPADVALCGVTGEPIAALRFDAAKSAAGLPGGASTIGRRVIDLAVETDYELFLRAGNEETAVNEYVIALYGAISFIYERDVNTAINLTYVRLWDDPNDLFNEIDPLGSFRSYWNANMAAIPRDVAQFISGRRNMPYGGIAYVSALCGSAGYSVCGYFLGSFPDTFDPSVDHYDIAVAAHELGHNCGTGHTHDYGLDTCDDLNGPARRGTIMSYCSQTRSGGNANDDLRFHTVTVSAMAAHITTRACVITDCNDNGDNDAADIASMASADANANGIPDECEDCNGNGALDNLDIAAMTSADDDSNGIPDECEPDCNGNGVPDAMDIALGTSPDAYGNRIPDECETDCNGNGISDYTEIQSNMALDLDRDAILDACQDCDGDGTSDLEALAGAWDVWVASDTADHLKRFHALSGACTDITPPGQIMQGHDVLVAAGGRMLAASAGDDRIVQFDRHGNYVGDFVSGVAGGLDMPLAMTFGPDGNLFVSSGGTSNVLEYDGNTGAFIGVFVNLSPPPASGQAAPGGDLPVIMPSYGLSFGPNGNLFATRIDQQVMEYDGMTGAEVGAFVAAANNGGLTDPRQLLFLPNGNLVVASFGTKELLLYDGATGAPLGKFNNGGTDAALTFHEPWGLRLGPDGFLYASRHGAVSAATGDPVPDDTAALHINSTRLYKYDPDTGDFIRSYVLGNDTGLDAPTGFDFLPGDGFDCNFNLVPDGCDIAALASADVNANEVPDECECMADINGTGSVDVMDLLAVLSNWGACGMPCPPVCPGDINADCSVNVSDLLLLLAAWGECGG